MSPASALELVPLEHLPPNYQVYSVLFRDVTNAAFLQSQLIARNPDFEYAFLDASAAISRLHILAAAFRAIVARHGGYLKTPNIHSETVLSMSASNNISEAYKKFGITSSTKDVVILKVVVQSTAASASTANPSSPSDPDMPQQQEPLTAEQIWEHLSTHVEGRPTPLTDDALAAITDWSKVHKMYKITGPVLSRVDAMKGSHDSDADSSSRVRVREKEVLALGGMALRGT